MRPEYTLIRSSRKTLSLEITHDAAVVVHALKRYLQREINLSVTQRESWVQSTLERQRSRIEQHSEPSDKQRGQLVRRAKETLSRRVTYHSGLMELHPAGTTITGAVSHFGSYSLKSRLCFSWRLMQYPMRAVDYVVVHGLTHIRHKSHGRGFYALVQSILPDCQERRQLLEG